MTSVTTSLRFALFYAAAGFLLNPTQTHARQQAQGTDCPLEVIKLKSEKQVRLPRNYDPSQISTDGAFSDPQRSTGSVTPAGGLPATQSNPDVSLPNAPGRLALVYSYSLRVRNTSSRVIDGVAWDYLFIDPTSNKEIGRHQFLSFEKIRPDKATRLEAVLRSAPTKVIQVNQQQKKSVRSSERASIQCVLYSDNTIWKNPSARPGICEFLASQRAILKKNQRNAGHR